MIAENRTNGAGLWSGSIVSHHYYNECNILLEEGDVISDCHFTNCTIYITDYSVFKGLIRMAHCNCYVIDQSYGVLLTSMYSLHADFCTFTSTKWEEFID